MSARGCSQQIIASALELKNLVDFSRIVILEKGPGSSPEQPTVTDPPLSRTSFQGFLFTSTILHE